MLLCQLVLVGSMGAVESAEQGPLGNAPRIVVVGDGSTLPLDGETSPYEEDLARELSGEGGWPEIIVLAAPEATSDDVCALIEEIVALKPDKVLIQVGLFDALHDQQTGGGGCGPRVPFERFDTNLRAIAGELREHGIEPVFVQPNPMRSTPELTARLDNPPCVPGDEAHLNAHLAQYAKRMVNIGRTEQFYVAKVYDAYEDLGPGDPGIEELVPGGLLPGPLGQRFAVRIIARLLRDEDGPKRTDIGPPPPKTAAGHTPPYVVAAGGSCAGIHPLPDGRLMQFLKPFGLRGVAAEFSRDGGVTWENREHCFDLPTVRDSPVISLRGRDGEHHLFCLVWRGSGSDLAVTLFLDIWHARTTGKGKHWSEPRRIWAGYSGAINGVAQLANGRIVLPFTSWEPHSKVAPPYGAGRSMSIYSDDNGATWHESDNHVVAPCYTDYNGNNYGGDEPAILERKDGIIWMLYRTQTGFLYQSFSKDGATWSAGDPSPFWCSTSPPGLLRLDDGRMMLFWNNCEMPPRQGGQFVYGGRDAIHAAISDDEGQTWRGYREVFRDPLRNEHPPKAGDFGTAYPFPYNAGNGNVLLLTGQGEGRRSIVRIDPDWLLETEHTWDAAQGLDAWHTWKPYGPTIHGYIRARTQGPILADAPESSVGKALHLRRLDDKDPDCALWNFPNAEKGELMMRVLFRGGFGGAQIALADRMISPGCPSQEQYLLARLEVDPQGRVSLSASLPLDQWVVLHFEWDFPRRTCVVHVDGEPLVYLKPSYTPAAGANYLRIRSDAAAIDAKGFLVEWVRMDTCL